jgi:MtrB/PioB family decaheme-associated outer membrane protein
MNTKKILLILSMMLFSAFPVFAAGGFFEGDLNVTGEWANESGNKAKLNEYRDMKKQGLYSGFLLKYDADSFFLQGRASDIGYDTQHYRIDGGMYGVFKLYMDYNEIPHNFTYDARTFYNGAGGNNLGYSVAPTADTSSWSHFDYTIKRRTSEGGFSLSILKPLYLNISASREERTGTMPTGVSGTTPGGIAIEFPQPVDYTTDVVRGEIGYAKKPFFASLSGEYSTFTNANLAMTFLNPASTAVPNTDALNLPPNNQYYKIAFKSSVYLPLNSRLNINLGTSRTTSEANLFQSYINATAVVPITLTDALFNGMVDTQNADIVFTTNPLSFLNAKVYYKYYGRNNRSDEITTTDGANTFTNELFSYHKNSYGIDLGFKLPARFYLQTAYMYVQTDRDRGDFPETRDNKYSTSLKWSGLEFITPKIGYERLQRGAEHGVNTTVLASAQATENAIGPYVYRFDAAPFYRDTVMASVDIYPIDNLNINMGYKYKRTDYLYTILGLRNVTTNAANIDVGYAIGRVVHLNAYADYEYNRSYQFQRVFTIAGADPNGATQNATNYNWDARIRDGSFSYGANAEFFLVPRKVTLVLQYDNVKSNGSVDLTYLNAAALAAGTPAGTRTNDNIDIGALDDYTLQSISAKLRYNPTESMTLVLGYAYESFTYNDASWAGYTYVPATTGTNGAFLTGAYANPNYHANVVFLSANYRF